MVVRIPFFPLNGSEFHFCLTSDNYTIVIFRLKPCIIMYKVLPIVITCFCILTEKPVLFAVYMATWKTNFTIFPPTLKSKHTVYHRS